MQAFRYKVEDLRLNRELFNAGRCKALEGHRLRKLATPSFGKLRGNQPLNYPPVLRHSSESALAQAEKGLHDCTMAHKSLILCVDDMASVLEGRQMLLEMYGYKVLTATNGTEAVKAFVTNPVDLVLLDYYMPEENGDVAARSMKAHKPDVPIALLSGDEYLPASALDTADTFIRKSEPINSFLEKVAYLLSLRLLFQPLESLKTNKAGEQWVPADPEIMQGEYQFNKR